MNIVDLNKVLGKLTEVLEESAAKGLEGFPELAPLRQAVERAHPELPFVPDDVLVEIGHMLSEELFGNLEDTTKVFRSQQSVNANAAAEAAIAKAKGQVH